jgi:acyl dehydratase
MLQQFGAPWLTSGELDVTLTRLILPGDTLTLRSSVAGVTPVEDGERVELEMSLVNQKGETVQSARAAVIVPHESGVSR